MKVIIMLHFDVAFFADCFKLLIINYDMDAYKYVVHVCVSLDKICTVDVSTLPVDLYENST